MGILKKNVKQRVQEQKLIDTLREIQRKKYQEAKKQESLKDKQKHLLFKEIKLAVARNTKKQFSQLSLRLRKGAERQIITELNKIKDIDNISYADLKKIVTDVSKVVNKVTFYETINGTLISKRKARKEIHEKLKEFLMTDKLSSVDKKILGRNINEWFKENNGSGSITFSEYKDLENFVFSNLSEKYQERIYSYQTEQQINNIFNQQKFQTAFRGATKEQISELKLRFKEYVEKTHKNKQLTNKDLNNLEKVLFKMIYGYRY